MGEARGWHEVSGLRVARPLIFVHHPIPTSHSLDSPTQHYFVSCDMSDNLQSSRIEALFESALHDYEKQTGIPLAKHPLAEQLQNCRSVDSVTALLQEQARAFKDFRNGDKIMKSLKSIVSALSKVSAVAAAGHNIGVVRSLFLIGFPPNAYSIVDPACRCNSYWPRYSTHRMSLCFFFTSVCL
jgi:hypothetical protein